VNIKSKILEFVEGKNKISFNALALDIFKYQAEHNSIYREFLSLSGKLDITPRSFEEIPCLPIGLYKKYEIKSGDWSDGQVFKSSGTTEMFERSMHHVKDIEFYHKLSHSIFKNFYQGDNYEILGLLPSYMEAGHSSLVSMVTHLMSIYNKDKQAFYMYDFEGLHNAVNRLLAQSDKTVLIFGVSFALLDFAESFRNDSKRLKFIFTGGMKGRRRELPYEEIKDELQRVFPSSSIDSEYGMTEMFSQAYTVEGYSGLYLPGKSLRLIPKEINDPFKNARYGKTAQLAFVDLGNVDTLSFVMTDDLCTCYADGSFDLHGRLKDSDLRGCNMLYQS